MWVLKTHISEIERISGIGKEINLCLLKNTKDRYRLLSAPEMHAIVKIESSVLKGARKYFEEQGFIEVVVPHMTKATGACENIATMFDVDYFGQKG